MRNYNYVDSCRNLEILLQDSGLLPKPKEDWNVFVPIKGDIAHVDEDYSDHGFDGKNWVKLEAEEGKEYTFDGDKWIEVEAE